MRKRTWQALLLVVLGFCATPAGAHTFMNLLACLPDGGGTTMQANGVTDAVAELPGGG
jgi:hypothetical protein